MHFRIERTGLEDKYDVQKIIGKGASGEVKLIRNKTTNEIRALKVMMKSKCQMTSNYSDEIRILQKLDHPNVVRFYEFYSDEICLYLVTEFCEGGDLLSIMSSQRFFSERNAAKIMRQILSAVEYCHKNKIVRRDLKPENIVFKGKGIESTLKIIDFGRSKILQPKETLNDKDGSLYYVAPEILLNKQYNEKCDVWSCGVIMYLLVAGYPPFYGRSPEEIRRLITSGYVNFSDEIWTMVSSEFRILIRKMLTLDMEKRFTASEALQSKWIMHNNDTPKVSEKEVCLSIHNLRNFRTQTRTQTVFQTSVLSYIASQQLRREEEVKIRHMFDKFDIDHDGQLSKKELSQNS